jgi:RNA ligase (TIGR02306 family)
LSEYHVQVFRLGKVGKHPNADTLSITQGPTGYPVVFKTGDFVQGDLAVYVPVDSVVDTARSEFAFLADKASLAGDGRFLFRVKSIKLRNIPSYGLLVPAPVPGLVEGQDVRELLGVTKYDPGPCYELSGIVQGEMVSLPQDGMVPLYDIEGMRRYSNVIEPGELVSVTEKIHGSNGRWAYVGGQFLCGSRTKFRTASVWNRIADEYNLEYILSLPENQGLVLYGEVYGKGIQDLEYGLSEPQAIFFDLYDSRTGLWKSTDEFRAFCDTYALPVVPELYRGPYNAQAVAEMAEGASTLAGANHVREGVVVKPLVERWDQSIGRVFLKQPGEGYLLRKNPDPAEEGRIRAHATFLQKEGQDWLAEAKEEALVISSPSAWQRFVMFLRILLGLGRRGIV